MFLIAFGIRAQVFRLLITSLCQKTQLDLLSLFNFTMTCFKRYNIVVSNRLRSFYASIRFTLFG